jgi:hypothetical protein
MNRHTGYTCCRNKSKYLLKLILGLLAWVFDCVTLGFAWYIKEKLMLIFFIAVEKLPITSLQ